MADPLTLALGEDRLSDLHAELEDLRAEVQAHRDGLFHVALDPMHAGQVVEEHYDSRTGEPIYHLQVTCQGVTVWGCAECQKLTISATWPQRCWGCGADGNTNCGQETYETPATCRSWSTDRGGQYDGPCLIAGSDGCDCDEEG